MAPTSAWIEMPQEGGLPLGPWPRKHQQRYRQLMAFSSRADLLAAHVIKARGGNAISKQNNSKDYILIF